MSRIETFADGVTLYLGDCREILPTLSKYDAVVSDPPYGLSYDYGAGHQPKKTKQKDGNRWGKEWGRMHGDNGLFDPSLWMNRQAVLWGAHHFCNKLPQGNVWLVWDKGVPDGMASSACELAWTSLRTGGVRRKKILWSGFRRETEVREHYHPTQKPVLLMEWCISQLKSPSIVLDPYMGSGSTGVAAIRLGLEFIGVEIEPAFFDVACRRIAAAVQSCTLSLQEKS